MRPREHRREAQRPPRARRTRSKSTSSARGCSSRGNAHSSFAVIEMAAVLGSGRQGVHGQSSTDHGWRGFQTDRCGGRSFLLRRRPAGDAGAVAGGVERCRQRARYNYPTSSGRKRVNDHGEIVALTTYPFDFTGRSGEYFRIWVVSLLSVRRYARHLLGVGQGPQETLSLLAYRARRHRVRVPRNAARHPQGTRDRARSARRIRPQRPRVAAHAARVHHHPAGTHALDRGRGVTVQRQELRLAQHQLRLQRRHRRGGQGISRLRRAGGGDARTRLPVRAHAPRAIHHRASPLRRHANARRPCRQAASFWPTCSRRS